MLSPLVGMISTRAIYVAAVLVIVVVDQLCAHMFYIVCAYYTLFLIVLLRLLKREILRIIVNMTLIP